MTGEVILYTSEDGNTQIALKQIEGSVWLSQAEISQLFQVTPQMITQHIAAIYADGELAQTATCKHHLQVQTEGSRQVSRQVAHYSLPMILAVGFRVRSPRGLQFRQWAAATLGEFLAKGFVMDDAKLKNPDNDYFEELLARIRDIRSSERLFYRKVLDIYATSVDYSANADSSERFFQTVQNKMHFATHGSTAAEIVHARADAAKDNMGLTSWASVGNGGFPTKRDAAIAKNYLAGAELETLNRIVTAYLEFAELQALGRRPMHMADWVAKLDEFLKLGDRDVLTRAGRISADDAKLKADSEYLEWTARIKDLPTPVERHFAEMIAKTKQIAAGKSGTKATAKQKR